MESTGAGIDFAAIPKTAVAVITSPAEFFRGMPKTGGFVEPLVFMVAMGIVGGIINAVISLLGLSVVAGMAAGVASIVVMPIAVAIGGFIGAAILFVIWKLMGSNESYETAYRCCAYMAAISPITAVLNAIPYAGVVISILISTYFIVIASVEVHNIPSNKAWIVFGIIGAIFILMGISSQLAARRLTSEAAKMQEASKALQEQAAKAMEQNAAQMQQAADAMKKAQEQMQQQGQMTPEQIQQMQQAQQQMQQQAEQAQQQQHK